MPCNTITTQTVSAKLAKALPAVLKTAMQAAGIIVERETAGEIQARGRYGESLTWRAGAGLTIVSRSANNAEIESKLVRAYSTAAVSWAATRAGWRVTATVDNKLTLQR